ncbi:type II/IV secretion system protein [bacterium]|jgi:type II secretory ATPase GspE/PulE/Tfp pilus assembly ATPase PilB-like protein|nr:type II/IV secretion system protein [bacterium]MBT3903340.1 type II/IV secretion system protein [bacterium]MBT4578158.1 type II/IV secretion system protein [bacterium]MBT5345502.1 type II/IV secretion system protein [bacterium]MBT6131196.1 type II/IV secretion system protein [bacterium]
MIFLSEFTLNNLLPTQLVDKILLHGIQIGASDVHIEPLNDSSLRVRMRIDGTLYDVCNLPSNVAQQIIGRIKVLASIDVAQKRVPQDGAFVFSCPDNECQSVDMRVATYPASLGEKLVVRLLDEANRRHRLSELGLSPKQFNDITSLLDRSHGFLLVTGPTGSGKTTTLYAALDYLNGPDKHIVTLEDPVEYHIEGITQAQINPTAGFTFAKGMRALLRQDPDVAMVGEIRDSQTARTAVEAALTGHVVLSTLHTNDAVSALIRLIDMGVEPFLVNAAVSGVIAQRLVRLLCDQCKTFYTPTKEEEYILQQYDVADKQLFGPIGCVVCNQTGFRDRCAIVEFVLITPELQELVRAKASHASLLEQAYKDGATSMLHHGMQLVLSGKLSLSELLRSIH